MYCLHRDAKISLQPRFDPTPEPGNSKGLDMVFDAHTDQVTSSVTKPFQVNRKCVAYSYSALFCPSLQKNLLQGFEALIDSRMEYPLMSRDKILIYPGRVVS